MAMSRKDYVAIADVIKDFQPNFGTNSERRETCKDIAECLANVMQADNPRFDRARFLKACGVQS